MRIEPLGDSAWIVRDLPTTPFAYAQAIENSGLDGVLEAVASYESVGIYVDPTRFQVEQLNSVVWHHASEQVQHHTIPVCYELGEDLESVSSFTGLSINEIITLHASTEYRCYAVGFCPGFPYLGYLPPKLDGTPRLPSPRIRVEPGSVAITGRQTGIYPLERPGGWNLIGKTPLCIVDVESAYFPLKAGDLVRFTPIGLNDYNALRGNRL